MTSAADCLAHIAKSLDIPLADKPSLGATPEYITGLILGKLMANNPWSELYKEFEARISELCELYGEGSAEAECIIDRLSSTLAESRAKRRQIEEPPQ